MFLHTVGAAAEAVTDHGGDEVSLKALMSHNSDINMCVAQLAQVQPLVPPGVSR